MAQSLEQFLAIPPDPQFFHVWPLLPRQGKLFIGAEAKSLKSMLALNMAYELAEGLPVLGCFKTSGEKRVLVIEQEIGQQRLQERLRKIHSQRGGVKVSDNLWVVSKDLGARLDTQEGLSIIRGHIEQAAPHVIVFDPLRKFHTQDEDSSTQMGALMRVIDGLHEQYDIATIIVHHHGKPREDRQRNSPVNLRGSSVLYDEGDSYVTVTRPDWRNHDLIQLSFVLRSAEDPHPMRLQLDPATLTFGKVLYAKSKTDKGTRQDSGSAVPEGRGEMA